MSTSDGLTDFGGVGDGADRHMVLKNTISDVTLTGALVLTTLYRNVLRIDPGGSARNVDLPDVATSDGVNFEIVNTADASEALTVRDSVTDGSATVVEIAQNEKATVYCDGAAWYHTGITTIALS
ncbi:MAG: hypothetical protein ACTSWM_04855 [Alphaproteobacteria bacterium]